MRTFASISIALILLSPCVAFAGDSPIFLVHGWGIGSIGDLLMLYLGDGRHYVTPIPLGRPWLVLYALIPAVIAVFALIQRRRDKSG